MSFLQQLKEALTASELIKLDEPEEELGRIIKGRKEKRKEPKIMFARWGSMNPKRRKDIEKDFNKDRPAGQIGFHTPPENKGIYAFIWPYVEPFLAAWQKDRMIKTGRKDEYGDEVIRFPPIKKFTHDGFIWTHLTEPAKTLRVGLEYKGSWVKVHTKDLPMLLRKSFAKDIKQLKKDPWQANVKHDIKDPYKRGRSGGMTMTRDHLEVFIPKVKESK